MRVAIVGSRGYQHLGLVDYAVMCLRQGDVVLSGGARGVDTTASECAAAYGRQMVVYPADWSTGRGAGYRRNQTIIDNADRVIAFHDGQSRGTAHSIGLAQKEGKPLLVVEDHAGTDLWETHKRIRAFIESAFVVEVRP